jgi:IS5 family transposase
MLGLLHRQASLFSFAFFKEAALIRDPALEPMDALLEDPALLAVSAQVLASRAPRSKDFGRPALAADRLLRCVVLKHLKGWSFRELEQELRASLLYRRFTRFYEDPIPNFTNLSRAFALFGKEGTQQIHQQVVQKARAQGLSVGHKLRTDTTAVETNIHHPTDSSLLADSLRVLTRSLKAVAQGCQKVDFQVVDHARAAKHRVLEISRAAKAFTQSARQQLEHSYGKLIGLTRRVVLQARMVLGQFDQGQLAARADSFVRVLRAEHDLRHYLPLVQQVIRQSQNRVFGGETRSPGKILSLFEPHSVVIRKGKAHKPNEFGRLVRIDEVEAGVVSHYHIAIGNPADQEQWVPALKTHQQIFAQAPSLAAADRGFWSGANERAAAELGVQQVVLPGRGALSEHRRHRQKQRWFRRGQGWRAGIEARIGTLKDRFGMRRAFYKGEIGFERYVGWCVIAQNLVAMTRTKPKARQRRCRSG